MAKQILLGFRFLYILSSLKNPNGFIMKSPSELCFLSEIHKERTQVASPVSCMKYQKKIKTDRYPPRTALLVAVMTEDKGHRWPGGLAVYRKPWVVFNIKKIRNSKNT